MSFGAAYFNDIISEKRAEKLNKIVRIIQSKPSPLILTRETWLKYSLDLHNKLKISF